MRGAPAISIQLPDPLVLEGADPRAVARYQAAAAIVSGVYALGILGFVFLHVPSGSPAPSASAPIFIDLPPALPEPEAVETPRMIPDLVPKSGSDLSQGAEPKGATPETPDIPSPMAEPSEPAGRPETGDPAAEKGKAPAPSTSTPVDAPKLKSSDSTTVLNFSAQAQANAREDWHARLDAYLKRFKQYPPQAHRRRETGTVLLHFVVDRKGRVLTYDIAQSSGYPSLDEAALDMIERANPLPPMPEEMLELQSDFVVGIEFKIE